MAGAAGPPGHRTAGWLSWTVDSTSEPPQFGKGVEDRQSTWAGWRGPSEAGGTWCQYPVPNGTPPEGLCLLDGSPLSPPAFGLNNFKDLLIVMLTLMGVWLPTYMEAVVPQQLQEGQRSFCRSSFYPSTLCLGSKLGLQVWR